jgi:predicted RNA-binding protein YlxR (DUF448 family)
MNPIRMCINCRNRIQQNSLIRLQCIGRKLTPFTNRGRSFYICRDCSKKDIATKRILKLCGNPKARDILLKTFEEIVD